MSTSDKNWALMEGGGWFHDPIQVSQISIAGW